MERIRGISSIVGGLAVASASLLSNVNPAQAAALTGRVFVNPAVGGGVIFEGSGQTAPGGSPLTGFDFLPPENGGTGAVLELNASSNDTPPVTCPGGSNFCQYVGGVGTINDLSIGDLTSLPNDNFIVINKDGSVGGGTGVAFEFDLVDLAFPSYVESTLPDGTVSTTVSLAFEGIFTHVGDGSNDTSFGIANVSADFEGFNIAQTQALFDEDGEDFGPINYSISIRASANIPESSNIVGLLAFGLVGSAFVIGKRKKNLI